MSLWTHVAGLIRIDDLRVYGLPAKDSIEDCFIANTWHKPNENGNLPTGSEGSLDVEIIRRKHDGQEYMVTVALWGDLRSYGNKEAETIKDWWKQIPEKLGDGRWIRQAVLEVNCEEGLEYTLTEKDMDLKE